MGASKERFILSFSQAKEAREVFVLFAHIAGYLPVEERHMGVSLLEPYGFWNNLNLILSRYFVTPSGALFLHPTM